RHCLFGGSAVFVRPPIARWTESSNDHPRRTGVADRHPGAAARSPADRARPAGGVRRRLKQKMAADVEIELLGTFADEAEELAQKAPHLVGKLAQAAPEQAKPVVEELARTAHNLKGAAAALGLDELSQLAHLIEAVLEPARTRAAPLAPTVADVVLLGLDALAAEARAIVRGRSEGERAALSHAWESLEALAHALGQVVPSSPFQRAAAPGAP